jgi:cytoskeleton protein RodZ
MSIGRTLRDARIAQGLTLEDVANKTKVRVTLLSLIESDQFEKVGAPTYVRGHIQAYARMLMIDEVELLKDFGKYSGDTPLDSEAPQPVSQFEKRLETKLDFDSARLHKREIKTSSGFNWSTLMVAALGLVLIVGVFSFVTRVNDGSQVPPLADSSEVFEDEDVQPAPTVTPGAEEDNLTASANNDLVLVVLEAVDGNSWVRASDLDDVTLFEGTIRQGESQTISNLTDVKILVGNAGAINVNLNGQPFGKIGGTGEVKRCSASFTTLECN